MPSFNLKSLIEALLFISEKPVSVSEMEKVFEQPAGTITEKIECLMREYVQQERGLRILSVAGGYQLCTAPEHAEWIKKFYHYRFSQRLSAASLEALAIIAYKQPITKMEVEAIRGVNMDKIMKNLLKSRLIKIGGRKAGPGRPFLYGTTREFLEFFGLRSLKDLPAPEEGGGFLPEAPANEGVGEKSSLEKMEGANVTEP